MAATTSRDPLFILGVQRSGTTQMLRLCREGLGYSGGDEGRIWQSVKALDEHFRRIEFDVAAEQAREADHFTLARLPRRALVSRYAELLLEMHHQAYGGAALVDKNLGPEAIRAAPLILQAAPGAKFIFMRRRGIENVLSQVRRFPDLPFASACGSWTRAMATWRETRGELGDSGLEIDQRDLGVAPHLVARELKRFLGHGDVDETARYLTTHFPEKTQSGDYSRYLSLRATGWDEHARQTFSDICADVMTAYGYSMEGERGPAPCESIDLAIAPHVSGWRIENGNPWISASGPGLRLHPNPPEAGPAILRFPAALPPGDYRFEAEIVVFEEQCRPHRLELGLGDSSEPSRLAIALDGSRLGKGVWSAARIEVPRTASIELTITLESGVDDALYSATQIVSLLFTRL